MTQNPFRKCLQKKCGKMQKYSKMTKNGQKLLKIPLEGAYRRNVFGEMLEIC